MAGAGRSRRKRFIPRGPMRHPEDRSREGPSRPALMPTAQFFPSAIWTKRCHKAYRGTVERLPGISVGGRTPARQKTLFHLPEIGCNVRALFAGRDRFVAAAKDGRIPEYVASNCCILAMSAGARDSSIPERICFSPSIFCFEPIGFVRLGRDFRNVMWRGPVVGFAERSCRLLTGGCPSVATG